MLVFAPPSYSSAPQRSARAFADRAPRPAVHALPTALNPCAAIRSAHTTHTAHPAALCRIRMHAQTPRLTGAPIRRPSATGHGIGTSHGFGPSRSRREPPPPPVTPPVTRQVTSAPIDKLSSGMVSVYRLVMSAQAAFRGAHSDGRTHFTQDVHCELRSQLQYVGMYLYAVRRSHFTVVHQALQNRDHTLLAARWSVGSLGHCVMCNKVCIVTCHMSMHM